MIPSLLVLAKFYAVSLKDDLMTVYDALAESLDASEADKLRRVRDKLLDLASKNLVKSNHSIMEVVMAAHLIKEGFDVDVERPLGSSLVCDVYAVCGGKSLIVEIETGFVPPENSLDPVTYRLTREASKVARYSTYSDMFGLATPPYHILQLPDLYFMPPSRRIEWGAKELKALLDVYYKNPPIELSEIVNAKLDYVYVIVVDKLTVVEYTAGEYYSTFLERPRQRLSRFLGSANCLEAMCVRRGVAKRF